MARTIERYALNEISKLANLFFQLFFFKSSSCYELALCFTCFMFVCNRRLVVVVAVPVPRGICVFYLYLL